MSIPVCDVIAGAAACGRSFIGFDGATHYEKTDLSIVKKPLLAWIYRGNQKLKLLLLSTVIVTVIIRVAPLEMQKRIVNQAIKLEAFDLLLVYCGFYLAAVVIAGGLKYLIAYLQTVIGQRVLTDMRKDLYRHVLTLPLSFFRKTQTGMVVQTFSSELATAGDFVGMAVAIPLVSVLSLVAFTAYLLWLNPLLANFSPFIIFLLGGYLAIKGQLELGALVAFLSAQEKLFDP
jgi:ABC-type bacteriocin/lantibiotic exporter with double-glycine peptidase domain